ncbi:hypothetical protein OAP83_02125 [Rickettsiales bacterium]|nr:hypothetical protein [Rickettsiales bacterium]
MNQVLTIIGVIAFLLFGALQFYAGYIGIDYHFGSTWAFVAIALFFIFRFTLPITIGGFFCAIDVWHWHWIWATLFVSPGLIFIVPGTLAIIISKITSCINLKSNSNNNLE